jgi:hypothetical protein
MEKAGGRKPGELVQTSETVTIYQRNRGCVRAKFKSSSPNLILPAALGSFDMTPPVPSKSRTAPKFHAGHLDANRGKCIYEFANYYRVR